MGEEHLRIRVDFQNSNTAGNVHLTTRGTVEDLASQYIALEEGMIVQLVDAELKAKWLRPLRSRRAHMGSSGRLGGGHSATRDPGVALADCLVGRDAPLRRGRQSQKRRHQQLHLECPSPHSAHHGGAMTTRMITLIADTRVVQLRIEAMDIPRSMLVKMSTDDGRVWSFEEPAWRELGYGVHGSQVYLWSARHLMGLPRELGDDLFELRTEEDLLTVFVVPAGRWLLLCETSVRLHEGPREVARVTLADVAVGAWWTPPDLMVRDQRGIVTRVTLVDGNLLVRSDAL